MLIRYIRNLLKTAVNRLDKNAAQVALKVLTGKNGDKDNPVFAIHTETEPTETVLYNKPVVSIKQSPTPAILKSVINGLNNCISRVRFFIKPKRFIVSAQR